MTLNMGKKLVARRLQPCSVRDREADLIGGAVAVKAGAADLGHRMGKGQAAGPGGGAEDRSAIFRRYGPVQEKRDGVAPDLAWRAAVYQPGLRHDAVGDD